LLPLGWGEAEDGPGEAGAVVGWSAVGRSPLAVGVGEIKLVGGPLGVNSVQRAQRATSSVTGWAKSQTCSVPQMTQLTKSWPSQTGSAGRVKRSPSATVCGRGGEPGAPPRSKTTVCVRTGVVDEDGAEDDGVVGKTAEADDAEPTDGPVEGPVDDDAVTVGGELDGSTLVADVSGRLGPVELRLGPAVPDDAELDGGVTDGSDGAAVADEPAEDSDGPAVEPAEGSDGAVVELVADELVAGSDELVAGPDDPSDGAVLALADSLELGCAVEEAELDGGTLTVTVAVADKPLTQMV